MIVIHCNTGSYINTREPNIKTKKGHRLVHILSDIRWYILIWSKNKKTTKSMICGLSFGFGSQFCRGGRTRTDDLLVPNQAYYQLYYTPINLLIPFCCAERGGFEPPVQNDPYVGLANRWFQPLTHLSLVL